MFHTFPGCGGQETWIIWNVDDTVTPAFRALATSLTLAGAEFVNYQHQGWVIKLRMNYSLKKDRAIDHFLPTQTALGRNIKSPAYQAGHCYAQVMISSPELNL